MQQIIPTLHCIDGSSSKSQLDMPLPLSTTETKETYPNLLVYMKRITLLGDHSHHIFFQIACNSGIKLMEFSHVLSFN